MTADVQAAAEVRPSPLPAAAPDKPIPVAAAQRWPARPRPTVWPQTLLPAEEILARGSEPPFASVEATDVNRRRGARKLLAWLASFGGQTWQERWLASGAETTQGSWLDLPVAWLRVNWPGAAGSHRGNVRDGNRLVLGGAVIRPSYGWLLRQPHSRSACAVARQVMDPGGFDQLDRALAADPTVTTAMRQHTIRRLTWIALAKGGAVADITVGDLLELLDQEAVGGARAPAASLSYRVLREIGVFPADSPPSLRATRTPGPRSVADLVEQYQLACRPVRDLLVDYLSERTAGADYSTRRQLVVMLAGNFWADLERHHPGIDSLHLPAEVAAGWKQRLRHVRDRDGRPVRERVGRLDVLINVRSFYLDLAQWAAEEPARWGPWVAPCPISAAETNTRKALAHRKARMDQRTRERLPVLPTLVRTAEHRTHTARRRLDTARAAAPGEVFTVDGEQFGRRSGGGAIRVWAQDVATGARRDLALEEEHAFWAWAAIEVLRHTGIRIEELLELTHHSFVSYRLPATGEVVPLLQIAPSKLDKERLLLVTPELGEVLAAVIHRVRAGHPTLPLISAYHTADQVWSAPMPFLFQRTHGPEQRAISYFVIRTLLDATLATTGLTDAAGGPLRFTPHDFRRIFITDAILHGLPPHIAQVIAGHADINTTIGYKAAYPVEAINTYRGFLARRRQARPSHEYRTVTPEEWDEFLGHFAKRKLSLGDCAREYGTGCQHEHACIRCPLLRPDPAHKPRLLEIRANLTERIDEARQHSWLGEVDGLQATLAAADQKLELMDDLAHRRRTVHIGMPAIPTGATHDQPHP
jgi:integrase